MADYVAATISIGGSLPPSLRGALAEAIAQQGVGVEFGDGGLLADEALTHIDETIRLGHTLTLCDAEAADGQFEVLETFLRTHGLVYRRTYDAAGDYDGHALLFDGSKVIGRQADQRGNVAVTLKDIESALREKRFDALLEELRLVEEGVPALTDGPEPHGADVDAVPLARAA